MMPEENTGATQSTANSAVVALAPATVAATYSVEDLATVRELAIAANPNAVPELITGNTPAEIKASVDAAKKAWDAVAAKVGTTSSAGVAVVAGAAPTVAVAAPVVPAGAVVPIVNVEALPTSEKISRGLAARKSK